MKRRGEGSAIRALKGKRKEEKMGAREEKMRKEKKDKRRKEGEKLYEMK